MREDLAGDITLEAPHDLSLGLAFGGAAGDVVLGRLVAAHADQGDAPQGAVGLPIAAAVQPVPVGTPGRNVLKGARRAGHRLTAEVSAAPRVWR